MKFVIENDNMKLWQVYDIIHMNVGLFSQQQIISCVLLTVYPFQIYW